jgi:hypothetical protein
MQTCPRQTRWWDLHLFNPEIQKTVSFRSVSRCWCLHIYRNPNVTHTHIHTYTHVKKSLEPFFNTQIYRSIGEYGGVQHASTINSPINAPREAFGVVVAVPEMLGGWGLQPWTFECQARHGIWDPLVNPMTIELFVIRPDSSYSSFLMGESGERTLDLYGFICIYLDLYGFMWIYGVAQVYWTTTVNHQPKLYENGLGDAIWSILQVFLADELLLRSLDWEPSSQWGRTFRAKVLSNRCFWLHFILYIY